MNDKKLLGEARKNFDRLRYLRIVNRSQKFTVTDPKKFEFWLKMCEVAEAEADRTGFMPLVYLTRVVIR